MNRPSKETIIRTVVMIITVVNFILVQTGHSVLPITDDVVTEIVTDVAFIGSAIANWWYNNSFTESAIRADKYLNDLKEIKKGKKNG